MTAPKPWLRASCGENILSIRARPSGSSRTDWSSATGRCALKENMRRFCILLISAGLLQGAALSHAAPPARLEIAYELSREGSTLADIVERLEHGEGKYQLLGTWKGRGFYAMLGSAKRSSRGAIKAGELRPAEFSD